MTRQAEAGPTTRPASGEQPAGVRARAWPARGRGLRFLLLVIIGCVGAASPDGADADTPPSEYQVKAALLLNFAKYIEWPESAFASSDAPLIVGVLGDDPFGSLLDQTFIGERIGGRGVRVKRSDQVEDMLDCHLLFVARSERDRVRQILATVGDRSIATVGELRGFAVRGGVVNFYIEDSKVRFEVNHASAERKGLRISSQLLRRARIVGPVPGRSGS